MVVMRESPVRFGHASDMVGSIFRHLTVNTRRLIVPILILEWPFSAIPLRHRYCSGDNLDMASGFLRYSGISRLLTFQL
jgi:hypothetical protein